MRSWRRGRRRRKSSTTWNREIGKVLSDPRVKDELARHGLDPMPGTRAELAQYIDRETAQWGKVVREAAITAE